MSNTSNKLLLDGGSKEPPKPNQPGGTSTDAASSPSTADEEERLRNWNLLGVAAPDFKPLSEMVSPLGQVAGSRSVTELARSTQNAGETTANLASLTIAQAQNQAQSAKGSDGVAAPAPTTGNDQSDPRNAQDRWFDDPKYRPAATTDGQPVPQTAGGEAGHRRKAQPDRTSAPSRKPERGNWRSSLSSKPVLGSKESSLCRKSAQDSWRLHNNCRKREQSSWTPNRPPHAAAGLHRHLPITPPPWWSRRLSRNLQAKK
jgi:hypothetical protein